MSDPGDFYTTLSNKVKSNVEKFCFGATLEPARYLSEKVFEYEPLPAFEWVTTIYCGSSHSGCTPRRAAGVKGGEAAEPCEGPLDGSQHRGQMAVR